MVASKLCHKQLIDASINLVHITFAVKDYESRWLYVDYDADICVVQTIHYFARCRLRSLVTKALLFNYSEMPKIAYAYMDCCVLHAYNDALKSCRTLQYYVSE